MRGLGSRPLAERREVRGMAKDPVCGMEVKEETAVAHEYKGNTYYFCTIACKETFARDPERYLEKK
jgi:Cu+-exporting ATPase